MKSWPSCASAAGSPAQIIPKRDPCHYLTAFDALRLGMANPSEIQFLDGPQSRWQEFKFTLQTAAELIRGFRALHFLGPCITVFGSARFKEDHPFYQQTRDAAAAFAKLGFTILTGGGPGLMEAANRGARDVGGRSVGCNIRLPIEQQPILTWINGYT